MIEKYEVIKQAETIVVPAHVERPQFRYSFDKEPLVRGDVVELVIRVNGKEVDCLKTEIEHAPEDGNEIRPVLHFNITETTAFTKE
jgi:hypothetical protein